MGAPLVSVPFCVLDIETTGGSPKDCSITEIGAVRYVGGELQGTFQTLVNPGSDIPPFITVLTGITQAMVIEAPPIEEVMPTLLEFVGDAVIVGHNVRFDLSFLNAACAQLGYEPMGKPSVDTLGLARRLIRSEVRSLRLDSLAAYLRANTKPTHRALDDAKATADVFHSLLERAGALGVTALEDLLALPTARGSAHYKKIALADELPRRPGVYLFRDRHDEVFYVGKAKNLRSRVRSYFYGDNRRRTSNMLAELEEVEYRVCATELEAEVTELRLIHAHRPRHNRRSKPPKSSHWVRLTAEPFPRLSLARTTKTAALAYLGPFRSRRNAELVRDGLWDAVPLRRCTGPAGKKDRDCSFAQLGVALCPCAGDLDQSEYDEIVQATVAGLRGDAAILLAPLEQKMRDHASAQRFEEAGWLRDRYRALARAIERRHAWQSLVNAGTLRIESASEAALIDHGRLVASWLVEEAPPLLPRPAPPPASPVEVPESVGAAEEAHLIWRWLSEDGRVIVDSTGPVVYPATPIPELSLAS